MLKCKIPYKKLQDGKMVQMEKVAVVPSTKGLNALVAQMETRDEYANRKQIVVEQVFVNETEVAKALQPIFAKLGDELTVKAFTAAAHKALDGACMFERAKD